FFFNVSEAIFNGERREMYGKRMSPFLLFCKIQTFALECPITSPCSQVLRFLAYSRYLCLLCPQFTTFLLVATDFGSVRYTVGSEVKAI
ncbi:hypothetical protein PANDA_008120, partial [Ailuropoda melanoleuca]